MYTRTKDRTEAVLQEIHNERRRQVRKHGVQNHLPDGTGPDNQLLYGMWELSTIPLEGSTNVFLASLAKRRCKAHSENEGGDGTITFEHILTEEFFEAMAEEDPDRLYDELIQVAAVAVQWCEKLNQEGRRR